jgi:YD repeat-containing protein
VTSSLQERIRGDLFAAVRRWAPEVGDTIGIECEYALYEDAEHIDFRTVIGEAITWAETPLAQETPLRYRFPDGRLLLCDGWYAELVTAPEPAARPAEAVAMALSSQDWLLELIDRYGTTLGRKFQLYGWSTHLNIRAASSLERFAFAQAFVRTLGPGLIALASQNPPLGVVCRPRPGRLEVITDFVGEPSQLTACLTWIIAGLHALRAGVELPRVSTALLSPAPTRYGWELTSEALATDLSRQGRSTPIALSDRVVALGDLLDETWAVISPFAKGRVPSQELDLVQGIVGGRSSLGIERPADTAPLTLSGVGQRAAAPSIFTKALELRTVGAWHLAPVFIDWGFVVYQASRGEERLLLNLPETVWPNLGDPQFEQAIIGALGAYAAAPKDCSCPPLASRAAAAEPGIYDEIDAQALSEDLERIAGSKKKKKAAVSNPPAATVEVDIYRLGHYPPRLEKHRRRPYYHERCMDPRQGAEILARPLSGTLGLSFEALLEFPQELKVSRGFTARVYLDPGFATWIDFTDSPAITFMDDATVAVSVSAPSEIFGVHFIRIFYDDLLKLHGQAVKVTIHCAGLAEATTNGEGPSPAVVATRVNLLVYNRDLGDAASGNGQRACDVDKTHHNGVNGNIYLPVPVTWCDGHGFQARLEIHYNSLHSSYGAALREMAICNRVSLGEIRSDFDSWLFGPGWTLSHDLRLFEYVIAEGLENEHLIERMELVCGDGNRIQLRKLDDDHWEPLFDTEVFAGDPDLALSLRLERTASGFRLTDKLAQRWDFDAQGLLVEIGDLRTDQGDLKPLKVSHLPGAMVITDSSSRETRLSLSGGVATATRDVAGAEGAASYRFIATAAPDFGTGVPLLERLVDPLSRDRIFLYNEPYFFLRSKKNRRDYWTTLGYYGTNPTPTVMPPIAQWFWGRAYEFVDGERRLEIRYLNQWPEPPGVPPPIDFRPIRKRQPVSVLDASFVETFETLDLDRMAVTEVWILPKAGPPLKRLAAFGYRDTSKAFHTVTDNWGVSTTYDYDVATGRPRARNLRERKYPEGDTVTYTHNPLNRVETLIDPSATTIHGYEATGELHRKEQSAIVVATLPTGETTVIPVTVYEHDMSGRLTVITDARGYKVTHHYGGPRDPGDCGLPTSIEQEVEKGGAVIEDTFEYDMRGHVVTITRGMTALTMRYAVDACGRRTSETFDGVTVMGNTGQFLRSFTLDNHDHVTAIDDSLGRQETAVFTRYDQEQKRVTRGGGVLETLEFDKRGNPLQVRNLTGFVKTYAYDEQDRLTGVTYPAPLGENEQLAEFSRIYDDVQRQVIEKQGPRTTTHLYDRNHRLIEVHYDEGDGMERSLVQTFQGRIEPHTVERRLRKVMLDRATYDRDKLGRMSRITLEADNRTLTTKIAHDEVGNVARVVLPPFNPGSLKDSQITHQYDGLSRRIRSWDSYNRVISEVEFDDASKIVIHRAPAPDGSELDAASPTLVEVRRSEIDARGNIVDEEVLGERVLRFFDAAGRLRELRTDANELLSSTTYTDMDAVDTITSPVTNFRIVKGVLQTADGWLDVWHKYDDLGNLVRLERVARGVAQSSPKAPIVEYRTDELGRRIEELRDGRRHLAFAYDALGRVKKITDAAGGVHSITYDEATRTVTSDYALGTDQENRTFTLDEAGWPIAWESSASPVSLAFEHNSLGLLKGTTYNAGGQEVGRVDVVYRDGARVWRQIKYGPARDELTYAFDENGRLTRMGHYQFRYNASGRLRFIDRYFEDQTEIKYGSNGKVSQLEHHLREQPSGSYLYNVDHFDDRGQPDRDFVRMLANTVPSQLHTKTTQTNYTRDGMVWREVIRENAIPRDWTLQVLRETAFNGMGLPFKAATATKIVDHPDASMRKKEAINDTKFSYWPDGRIDTVSRRVMGFDGKLAEQSTISTAYDARGNLAEKTARKTVFLYQIAGQVQRNKIITDRFVFKYDANNRLVRVETWQSYDPGGAPGILAGAFAGSPMRKLKTTSFFYGPSGEMLGERRVYHDGSFKNFVDNEPYLKDHPTPLYCLHDGGAIAAQVSATGELYLGVLHAPGGAFPLELTDHLGATYIPHQDENGTTQLLADSMGRYHSYLPLVSGDPGTQALHASVSGGQHRLGDGALPDMWGHYLTQAIPQFRYLGESSPFDLTPAEPSDLSGYSDSETSAYGEKQLSSTTVSDLVWDFLEYEFNQSFLGETYQKVELAHQRYLQLMENGATVPGLQVFNSAVGDFFGYTDLLEGVVGADLATSSRLSTARRWFKGIMGGLQLITTVGGAALGESGGAGATGLEAWQRQMSAITRLHRFLETTVHIAEHIQKALSVAELVHASLMSPDDPSLDLLRNSPFIYRRVGPNLGSVEEYSVGDGVSDRYLSIISLFYGIGLQKFAHLTPQAQGRLADEYVQNMIMHNPAVRVMMLQAGIEPWHVYREPIVSRRGHSIDSHFPAGHALGEMKRTIHPSWEHPVGRVAQEAAHISFAQARRDELYYVVGRVQLASIKSHVLGGGGNKARAHTVYLQRY